MPRFRYTAISARGQHQAGVVAATSREDALSILSNCSVFVTDIAHAEAPDEAEPWWRMQIGGASGLPLRQLTVMTRELATLISANLPVDEALQLASMQSRMSRRVQSLLSDVRGRVQEGDSLSQAFAAQKGTIPEFMWRLVEAGETAGKLPLVLERLADYLQAADRKRGQLLSALLYPAFLVLTAFVALLVVMSVMVPAIHPLFRERGVAAPFMIEVMARLHGFVMANTIMVGLAGVAAAGGLVCVAVLPSLTRQRSRLKLAIPVVGRLLAARETARFSRILSILLGNGVPMVDALRAADGVLTNCLWRDRIVTLRERLIEGGSLSEKISEAGIFPELAVRLISSGEKTGTLVEQLARVADIHERDVEQDLDRGLALLGPILTVGIGLVIGAMMLSILQGLLSVNELGLR